MAGHDRKERLLLTDIKEKNRLANEFCNLSSDVRRWRDRLEKKRGKRWQAQYRGSLERASARLENLRGELLAQAEDLKARIETEQEVSKSEIAKFQKQYEKEVLELANAQAELAEARKAFASAEAETRAVAEGSVEAEKAAAVLADLRRRQRLTRREAKREGRDKAKVEQEISSEEKDKVLLSHELQRTIAEIEALRGPST